MSYKITSLTNRIWNVRGGSACEDIVDILARNRGIEDVNAFINTSVRNVMPDPFVFIDMERAVNSIVLAIRNKRRIAILGDYDVDGISSVSIFIKFLERIGADHAYSIPSRFNDGYGLSIPNIEKHRDCLIVAVDCGSNSREELNYVRDNGIDLIVIDHHKMATVCDGSIIVNPHRPDEKGHYQYLCAAGLVFLCIVGVNRQLREVKFYSNGEEPNLMDYLDMVAIATVCDVVTLAELNRAFVSTGLKVIGQRKNIGIDALLFAHKDRAVTSETIAFFLGPRLNASGRMASADMGVKLLTTRNPVEAKEISLRLEDLNRERQLQEMKIMEEATQFVKDDLNFICSHNADWYVGIIGIIAGRLREKYNKPSIIICCDSNGVGKASCRSIEGVDISAVIRRGIEKGVIISGGGHSMAAGFSMDMSKIDDLLKFLKEDIKYKPSPPELYADCIMSLDAISIKLVESMSVLEPFGAGNRYPKFVVPNIKITQAKIVGENHIAFVMADDKGNSLRAISFRSLDTPLGSLILAEKIVPVSLLGTLSISSWNNQQYVSFQLEDMAESIKI
ncbi:MAG: single-stranded-DNA-specific exonuclease RecJ [Holosporaceae bacterium]|jgi:single-stranded-DNA-specific exonuclease|nr:single-stranded-DNA-specific exonuclease RecJ [Holosporaceae bacterium]